MLGYSAFTLKTKILYLKEKPVLLSLNTCGYLLHQRVGDGFREGGEGAAERRALPVENSYRQQSHAGALALEGQVEPRFIQLLHTQQFDV